MIKEDIHNELKETIKKLSHTHQFKLDNDEWENKFSINISKNKAHGDYSTNIAMVLSSGFLKKPLELGKLIKEELEKNSQIFSKIEILPPGFINLSLNEPALTKIISKIALDAKSHGLSKQIKPKKVLLEFVSANPTGGLHLGHARPAFVGDAIARLLKASGFIVSKEFYVNDEGNQISTLAKTIYKRYQELFGEKIEILANEYPGAYVIDIAKALKERDKDSWLNKPESDWLLPFAKFGVDYNLKLIKNSLANVDIEMDSWFLESSLHKKGVLEDLLKDYEQRGMLYEAESAENTENKVRREESKAAKYSHLQTGGTFLKTTLFGDDEDRIIRRADGRFVYLTADIAYHREKLARGYEMLIDIFGADHGGHTVKISAALEALGYKKGMLKFILVQMVRLIRDGQEVKFSKRSGEIYNLDDLISEIGQDAARVVFLMRSANSQFDLDLNLITKKTHENPVFYVQYGHARTATILKKAKELGFLLDNKTFSLQEQKLLILPEEREMLLKIADFSEVVRDAAYTFEPHKLIYYTQELIKIFHSYFTKYKQSERIISDNETKTYARLWLVFAIKVTIHNALKILGINAPEYMEINKEEDDFS